jgi:hypothetical protein
MSPCRMHYRLFNSGALALVPWTDGGSVILAFSGTPAYRVILQLYGHLLEAHVTGRMLCIRNDGRTHYRHFKLRFEKSLLGVGGPTGRFRYTSRPLTSGWTRYGVDEALDGQVGPPRTLPGSFDGAFEYAVRRPWVRCRTGTSADSAEVPFRVERVKDALPPRFPE